MNIRDLIGLDKVPEALEQLLILTKELPKQTHNKVVLIESRFNSFLEKKRRGLLPPNDDTEKNMVKDDILDIYTINESYFHGEKNELKAYCQGVLFRNKKVLFIDRNNFRNILKESLQTDGAKLIFVKNKPKNGMSYLEHYLIELCKENRLFQSVLINIGLENENSGYEAYELAKIISGRLQLGLNLDQVENSHFKFVVFLDKLRERLDNYDRIPIIYIHDFHKVTSGLDLFNSFLYQVANQFRDFPKVIFIVAGLLPEKSISDWHNLKYYCPVCELEELNIDMVNTCLKEIYYEYHQRIAQILRQPLTEKKYIDNMFKKIEVDGIDPLNIMSIGPFIAEHLDRLNQQ